MNKYKQLSKQIARSGVVALVVVGISGAVFGGISFFASSVEESRAQAEKQYNEDKSKRNNYSEQMSKSNEAEKRYAAIQESRSTADFAANFAVLRTWLVNAKERYRLSDPGISSGTEAATAKPMLKDMPYDITERSGMKLTFKAVSDVHAFSLLEDMRSSAPGMFRVEAMELKRTGTQDLDEGATQRIRNGVMPLLVDATIELKWIGIVPKPPKDTTTPTPTP